MTEPDSLPSVKKVLSSIKGDYYLQLGKEPLPICKGCFNAGGSCGTPCLNCERIKAWEEEWIQDLIREDYVYVVWRRKVKK